MGTFRETLAEGTEGTLHLGPEWDRVFTDLTPEEKKDAPRRFIKLINYDNSKSSTVKERNERARARERLDEMNGLSLRALSQRSY
ncbi:hypothetical protein Tco_0927217 [Tanacetum coccineum]